MSLFEGQFSFIRFRIPDKISFSKLLTGLQDYHATDSMTEENPESYGWSCVQNFLDTKFTEEKVKWGKYYCFSFRYSKKSVPASLIRAHCQQEELRILTKTGKEKLSRYEKNEIKAEIKKHLLEEQPIEYTAYDCMIDSVSGVLYFGGSNKKLIKSLVQFFELSYQVELIQLDAVSLAGGLLPQTKYKALQRIESSWFGPKPPSEKVVQEIEEFLGLDFLTWLWYLAETDQAEFELDGSLIGGAIEDFLLLVHPYAGPKDSQENTIKNGLATQCPEAKAALASGKKLQAAKFLFADAEEQYIGRIDVKKFSLSGVKFPRIESLVDEDSIRQRLESIEGLTKIIDTFYGHFLMQRISDDWDEVEKEMVKWVSKK